MTNNYPERQPGGRGAVGVPPSAGSPGREGHGRASPGPQHSWEKSAGLGSSVMLKMFTVSIHQTSEIQMGSEIPLL